MLDAVPSFYSVLFSPNKIASRYFEQIRYRWWFRLFPSSSAWACLVDSSCAQSVQFRSLLPALRFSCRSFLSHTPRTLSPSSLIRIYTAYTKQISIWFSAELSGSHLTVIAARFLNSNLKPFVCLQFFYHSLFRFFCCAQ